MKELISNNKIILIDDDCYPWLSLVKWYCVKDKNTHYAVTNINGKNMYIHRLIMNAQKGQIVDHKDRCGLNNQRHNLRFVTRKQNAQNSAGCRNSLSGYKGVSRHRKSWRAVIRVDGEYMHIGQFNTKEEAAMAYNIKAQKYFGEYAFLNNVGELERE